MSVTLTGQSSVKRLPEIRLEDYPGLNELARVLKAGLPGINWGTAETTNGAACVHYWDDNGTLWVGIEPGPGMAGWSAIDMSQEDEETLAHSPTSAGDAALRCSRVLSERLSEAAEVAICGEELV